MHLHYVACLHINVEIKEEVKFIKFSLWIHFACHSFLAESLYQLGLLISNLLSLLVLCKALWNRSFMQSDKGVTYVGN